MKTLIATLLATAAGASFAFAPTAALNHDPVTNVTQKAAATGSSGAAGVVAATSDPAATKAVNKCEQMTGNARSACLVENKPGSDAAATRAEIANRSENAAERAVDNTRTAAATTAEKTKELAQTAVEKTKDSASTVAQRSRTAMVNAGEKSREVASTAAQKTENAMDRAGEKTRDTAATVADKTDRAADTAAQNGRVAANKTAIAASDTAITSKVKADLLKEPDLKSMGIHVETENSVVMLSGFVDSKAEAEKAAKVAKGVEGVASVKSAIKVK